MAVSVVFWTKESTDNDDSFYGIFLRESGGNQVSSKCHSDMTDIQCGYLNSSKASAVISIIFGTGVCAMYLMTCGSPGFGFFSFAMGLTGLIQSTFGLMCLVIFSYFKRSYLTSNDDMNVEYPNDPEVDYAWAFYIVIASVVISYVSSAVYIVLLFKSPATMKRTRSDEPLFAYEA
eukprot:CAMPEP_0185017746 /NCGR_PEP_ID=MMETSP1103-20130426/659_1 /TAXON_ID=36769 /ORGANISM="Paraphysomonas bandaiensis, Strain Caron Lab Isolate" /LENGTH=175 /DNA_ID=CAMNT_0027547313 /DNA_START=151 /DNA_END=678 /DNA_ORIENTATION=+